MSFRPRSLIAVLTAGLALGESMVVRSRETTSTDDALEPFYLPGGYGTSNGTNGSLHRRSTAADRVKRGARAKARKRARCKVRRRSHRS